MTSAGDQKALSTEDADEAASSLASLLEASSDAIYTEDPAGVISSWNRGAQRLFGYGADEALGRRSDMLFPVQLRGQARELVQRVLVGEVVEQLETEVSRRDGMVVPVSLNLSPIRERSGHISGATVVARDVTEQKLALDTLAESEARLQEAQALAHVGIWIWDATTSTVQWSDELYRIHGVNPMDFDGTYDGHLAMIAADDRERVDRALTDAVERTQTLEAEFQIVRPGGERRWIHARAEPVGTATFSAMGLRGIYQDVTEQKQAEAVLRRHAELLGVLQRIAAAANEAQTFEEALGSSLRDICAHGDWSVARAVFVSGRGDGLDQEAWHVHKPDFAPVAKSSPRDEQLSLDQQEISRRGPIWVHLEGGGTKFSFPVLVGSQVVATLEFFAPDDRPRDEQIIEAMTVGASQLGRVFERTSAEETLAHQALHDPLTDLPNRTMFLNRLHHALLLMRRRPGLIAVLFLDLDGFKMINDSLGHEAGDELLKVLADRLQKLLRGSDTVARFGGDEFTVLCEDLADEDHGLGIARRVADAAATPVALQAGQEVALTASVGIAFSRGDGTPEGLLRDADLAMYRAKEQGPARCEIFDEALHARATKRLETIRALGSAVELDQLRLFYQPQVSLLDGGIFGVEALVRWEHPERGLLGPLEFIPLAEESQLVTKIGAWVIAEACRQAARWREELARPLKISVNVSARQLASGGLADSIKSSLEETGTEAAALCVEITENVLMGDADFYLEALLGLKFLGVSLAVDDFGMGYSSLAYLKRFPIDILKIDKAFVDGLGRGDARSQAIPRAVITLALDLGMTPVAEGVETVEQARELTELNCRHAQGYYFARPHPPDTVTELLHRESLP